MEYAAAEVSPHKQTWPIHPSRPLHELAPELCPRGAVHELAANIVFRALAVLRCRNYQEAERRKQEFKSDLFTACSNLFEVHYVHQGAETVFGVLNKRTLKEISPTLKLPQQQDLRALVVDTLEEWVQLHPDSFSRINASRLFAVVGPGAFAKLIPRLSLSVQALSGENVEVLFYHLTEEAPDIFSAMRIAISFLPVEGLTSSLGGSRWTLRRVLAEIERRRSEHVLRFFLAHLEPASLLREALAALRARDFDTGLVSNPWSFSATLHLEADLDKGRPILPELPPLWPMVDLPPPLSSSYVEPVDDDREVPRGQRIWLLDGELMPFTVKRRLPLPLAKLAPPSRFRDTPWPQLAFDPEEALAADRSGSPSSAIDAYRAVAGDFRDVDALDLWAGDAVETWPTLSGGQPGLPHPQAALPLDAVHLIDSAQALSHVLTFLQEAPPDYIGIDVEWTDPHMVSVIQVATASRAFVLDCVNRTPLYMSVLHCLVDWLLKREATTKLFFGFPHDLVRLNLLFAPHGKSFGGVDHIASVVDLYAQRVQRVKVLAPRLEDTPLGREALLGKALQASDLEEVHRLGATVPPHPPRVDLAEQVFLIGGHHSLAAMVERYLHEGLDKSFRTSNWNFRPLSALQVLYAATDAHVLLRLEAAMRQEGVLPQRVFGSAPPVRPQPAWWRIDMPPDEAYRVLRE